MKHCQFNVLSIMNNSLLAGYRNSYFLYQKSNTIYTYCVRNNNFTLAKTINTSYNIRDVIWTPSGEIVIVNENSHSVITMKTRSNLKIHEIQLTDPSNLTLSSDNVLLLTDWKHGVYESTNNGKE